MASNALRALCGLIIAAVTNFYGVSAQKSQCGSSEFWNSDLDVCLPCASCKQYPKTPSCNTCKSVDETPDVWKLAAITSFSVLAVVLVGAALIIGVMVHRRKSHKRPLRGEILQRVIDSAFITFKNPLKRLRGHFIKLKHFTSSSSGNRCDRTKERLVQSLMEERLDRELYTLTAGYPRLESHHFNLLDCR
ncbi:hypothetical protein L3Q82_010708, partial [Scortum barcoo]